jgi:hypothetical protein
MTEYAAPRLPLGVAILAVLAGIFGAFVLIAGFVVVLFALLAVGSVGWTAAFGTGLLAGLITFILGSVVLAIAFGLWDQELWAFVIAIIATACAVGWFVALPLMGGGAVVSVLNVPAVISAVLLVYLLAVQDHFY